VGVLFPCSCSHSTLDLSTVHCLQRRLGGQRLLLFRARRLLPVRLTRAARTKRRTKTRRSAACCPRPCVSRCCNLRVPVQLGQCPAPLFCRYVWQEEGQGRQGLQGPPREEGLPARGRELLPQNLPYAIDWSRCSLSDSWMRSDAVLEGANMPSMDSNGKSDPYCSCYFLNPTVPISLLPCLCFASTHFDFPATCRPRRRRPRRRAKSATPRCSPFGTRSSICKPAVLPSQPSACF
jgi:hypothetical protein